MSWTPLNPGINKHDIVLYIDHLTQYVKGNRDTFSDDIYGFFRNFLADEIIDGRTRKQWKAAHVKCFSILKPGIYPLHYYPDGDIEDNGQVEIIQECIINCEDYVKVSWGAMERYISVDPTHSTLDIESLDLPRFSQSMCKNITRN